MFNKIEFGNVPVVAALHGAVVGGGLELAATAHVRVAERSAFYALPEGVRGIFVGGGGSVRIPRLIGTSRMMEMMLTGRVLSSEEGQAMGISHYLVEPGTGLAKALELAGIVAKNAWLTNFGVIQALPRIAEQDPASGYVMEALMASIAGGGDEAKARVKAFLEKRAPKVSTRIDRPGQNMAQSAKKITAANAPFRPVRLGPRDFRIDRKDDGTIYLSSPHPLPAYPAKLTERLVHWAMVTPETIFMADRVAGAWRKTSYADALSKARSIGQALINRKLTPERPVAILSGNDLEHQWLMLAAMHVGIPAAPISPAYSLISSDFANLKHIFAKLTPGLVFVNDGAMFSARYRENRAAGCRGRRGAQSAAGRRATLFSELLKTPATAAVDDAFCKSRSRHASGNSCSPRARPASPRASSTRSACCVPTRR